MSSGGLLPDGGNISPTGCDVANMTESQFKATLDALLEMMPANGGGSIAQFQSNLLPTNDSNNPNGSFPNMLPPPPVATTTPGTIALPAESSSAAASALSQQKGGLTVESVPTGTNNNKSVVADATTNTPSCSAITRALHLGGKSTASSYPHLSVLSQASGHGKNEASKAPPQTAAHSNQVVGGVPSTAAASLSVTSSTQQQASVPQRQTSRATATPTRNMKRSRSSFQSRAAISEDESEREKRRQDRNSREQQRSQQITNQIASLRDVLTAAKIDFKPDKFSTLATVVSYIKQLQDRSTMLDSEHQRLLQTIARTTEIINNQYVPVNTSEVGDSVRSFSNDLLADGECASSSKPEDESLVFVQGIDYKSIFGSCPVAEAVLSIDGRFMDSNAEFEQLSGHTRDELLPIEKQQREASSGDRFRPIPETESSGGPAVEFPVQRNLSLFNVLFRSDMEKVFGSMSEMLKRHTVAEKHLDSWHGAVQLCKVPDRKVKLCITLVRSPQGRPRFFTCTLIPAPL